MLSIEQEDVSRFSSFDDIESGSPPFTRSCIGPLRSFSYDKLPQQLFNLTILKLDGSSFEIEVAGTASVDELRQAIEYFFIFSSKEGRGKISWSHVWGHFCLCFKNRKLINDKASIRSFGINDGDQLCFIRHLSINYNAMKSSRSINYDEETRSDSPEERKELYREDNQGYNAYFGDQQGKDIYSHHEDGATRDFICQSDFKLSQLLRGWLSYSRLWSRKLRSGNKSARFAGDYFRVGTETSLL